MNLNIATIVLILLFTSIAAVAWAESSVNIDVRNKVNTNQNSTSNTTSNSTVKSSSTNTSKVTNHIEVEVNGEKRVIDDTQEGSNINSNIKVEAKSENGQTTFNIEGNPQSVKSETTTSNSNLDTQPIAQSQPLVEEKKEEDKSLVAKIVDFFKGVAAFFNFFS